MYYLFYTQKNPFLTQELMAPFKNNPDVESLGKVYFTRQENFKGRQLLIAGPGEVSGGNLLKTINFLNGNPAFEIWEKTN